MRIFAKLKPEWMLRLGLGAMYLYSGYDFIANPQHWYGFVPQWFSRAIVPGIFPSIDTYLRIQGAGELLLGIAFLAWFLPRRWLRGAAFLAALEMALIIFFVGVDPITFRDIGLLGAALALLALLHR